MVFVTLIGSIFAVGLATMVLKWAVKAATTAKDQIMDMIRG